MKKKNNLIENYIEKLLDHFIFYNEKTRFLIWCMSTFQVLKQPKRVIFKTSKNMSSKSFSHNCLWDLVSKE